ncbi:MAG: acetate kinase [Ktedonobacteraceae bacterium]
MKILVLNAGSSSQKSRLYEIGATLPDLAPRPLWAADADWTKDKGSAELDISTSSGKKVQQEILASSLPELIKQTLKTIWSGETQILNAATDIDIVGHRVVHGGPEYRESVFIDQKVKDDIHKYALFAPLHNSVNLEGIQAVEHMFGDKIQQVATFDTAFHKTLPMETVIYPGPYEWYEQGIRRYGFHGISHQYCTERIGQILQEDEAHLRIINCHLGNGCSLAAIRNGESVDTTMGFTPLEGVMMGSRTGTVDPSILIYLQREKGYTADQFDQILNKESGLKGISGISNDVRQVHKAVGEGNARAKLALDIYIYRLRYYIGAMIAVLGGVDVLSFAGGVGEHDDVIRTEVCKGFEFLNLKLDMEKNKQSLADQVISTNDSGVRVLIVHTEEDWEIAKECWKVAQKKEK